MSDAPDFLFDNKPVHPGDQIRRMLMERGWTQAELAEITDRSVTQINDLIKGKRGITAETAVSLAAAFRTTPQYWMDMDSAYRISQAAEDPVPVQHRARLYEFAPVKEMQKRGWIRKSRDIQVIETELMEFFSAESLEHIPEFPVSTRKTAKLDDLTPAQRAWCFRAKQLAGVLQVKKFNRSNLPAVRNELRKLAAFPKNVAHLPQVFLDAGIRFLVIEPLSGAKIDGAAFWLDDESPVIAVTVRYDRIDAFWFTVMHEFAHIEHGDSLSVDSNLAGDLDTENITPALVKDDMERRADEAAAASLVPPSELQSFVRRVSPLYHKTRISQFASRIKMHPGIIVGQLQHLGELGYGSQRELLVKIRSFVTDVAFTDGWGRTIGPDIVKGI